MSAAARSRASRGCSRASSSVSQSAATGVPKTLAVPVTTAGTPTAASAARTVPACSLVRTSTATSPGRTGRAVDRRRAAEQARHVGRQIGDDQLARGPDDRHVAPRRGGQARAGQRPAPAPARRRAPRAAAVRRARPRPGARRSARRRARRRRTPSRSAASRGASLRWLVASVAWLVGRARGLQVGDDVGAAERVDRLLGVADQHQRGVAVEGAAQDRPLHGIGVLELVDQHHPVARPQPGRGFG